MTMINIQKTEENTTIMTDFHSILKKLMIKGGEKMVMKEGQVLMAWAVDSGGKINMRGK